MFHLYLVLFNTVSFFVSLVSIPSHALSFSLNHNNQHLSPFLQIFIPSTRCPYVDFHVALFHLTFQTIYPSPSVGLFLQCLISQTSCPPVILLQLLSSPHTDNRTLQKKNVRTSLSIHVVGYFYPVVF